MAYQDYQPLFCILIRSCDSHNLNVSPFCKLGESTVPVRWANEVQGLYKDIPGYIKELKSPMRDVYKTADMRKQDLLKTEVTNLSGQGFFIIKESSEWDQIRCL